MPIGRRIVATALALLTVAPAHVQAQFPTGRDIREGAKKVGAQALSDALLWAAAKTLGIKDPVAERRLSPADLASAATARQLFDATYATARAVTYDPRDAEGAAELTARYRRVAERIGGRKTLTSADLAELAPALLPFIRYVAAEGGDGANRVVLLPGQARRVTFQAYCMDHSTPAPRSDEHIHLVRRERVIPPHGAPMYAALMQYSAQKPQQHAAVQNLVWGMRHARAGAPFIRQLSAEQEVLLDAATAGGAGQYRQYLAKEMVAGRIDEIKTKIYQRAVAELERSIGRPLPPPSSTGYAVTDVNTALRYLQEAVITAGAITPDSNYTLLRPGVAARSVSGAVGVQTTQFDFLNQSCEPYTFNGDDYVGQSTRVTQRIALGGVVGPSREEARTALVQALGADRLKLLERKLSASSEPLAKLLLTGIQFVRGTAATASAMNDVVLALSLATGTQPPCAPRDLCDIARRMANLKRLDGKDFSSAEKRKLQELSRELLGALAMLSEHREAFLRDGKPIDVFPAAYYHVTAIEMERIANGEFTHPIEKMQQLIAFFSAYETNRQAWDHGTRVETHWQSHFRATSEGPSAGWDYGQALYTGITAHVDFDLPRAIRDSFDNRFHGDLTRDDLRMDFNMTNDTLRRANTPTLDDWIRVAPDRSGEWAGNIGQWGWVGELATNNVLDHRSAAWNLAAPGKDLPTKAEPQPPTDRAALARAADAACGAAQRR